MSKDRYAISSLNPHTHAGCDTVMGEDVSQRDCFNPHTHAGCDFTIVKISGILLVSIHTPTQGVTSFTAVTLQVGEVSIHTPTQGVTLSSHRVDDHYQFQSTHPRRVWHSLVFPFDKTKEFQSTHPRRVWPEMQAKHYPWKVSIHTPTQGVTTVDYMPFVN